MAVVAPSSRNSSGSFEACSECAESACLARPREQQVHVREPTLSLAHSLFVACLLGGMARSVVAFVVAVCLVALVVAVEPTAAANNDTCSSDTGFSGAQLSVLCYRCAAADDAT